MVDALNINPVSVYSIYHQILMFPETDRTVAFGSQYAVITKLQRTRYMGKASYRFIKIICDAYCCLLILKLIDKIIYNFPKMCLRLY